MSPNWEQLKVQGVKLRVFKDQGSISKRLVVQGGLMKFPKKKKKGLVLSFPFFFFFSFKEVLYISLKNQKYLTHQVQIWQMNTKFLYISIL
jgi:hypothetical protein